MSDVYGIDDLLRFYESPDNFDVSVHDGRAVTVGVENVPIAQQQNVRHIPHVQFYQDVDLTITAPDFSVTFAPNVVQLPPIRERINYIGISPTIRNAEFHLSFRGLVIPILIGSVWFPLADLVARSGQGTVFYRVPTMQNMVLSCVCYPSGESDAYTDKARIIYGYLPDGLDKLVVE